MATKFSNDLLRLTSFDQLTCTRGKFPFLLRTFVLVMLEKKNKFYIR